MNVFFLAQHFSTFVSLVLRQKDINSCQKSNQLGFIHSRKTPFKNRQFIRSKGLMLSLSYFCII